MAWRKAKRSEVKPLVGLFSASGAGKTYSALLLARGFVGPNGRIGMIDTESGRGEAYADIIEGGYQVEPMRDDFGPKRYEAKIKSAEKEKFDALIIDSVSHEWEGTGGVLSMAADNEASGITKRQVWTKPKVEHNRHFILPLLQTPIPLVIVCMRAKFPLIETGERDKSGNKKMAKSKVPVPIQSDGILYEMFIHGWINHDHEFIGTKYTRPDLEAVIPTGERISYDTGRALARWSEGEGTAEQRDPTEGSEETRATAAIVTIGGIMASKELEAFGGTIGELKLSGQWRKQVETAFRDKRKEFAG